jgi:hypothetical protein
MSSPTSTIAELRDVLINFEAARPRSMQKELGPSELGTSCQQQIARKLTGAPRVPITEPTWAPFQGTAVHASMEDVLAFWNAQLGRQRWLTEDRVTAADARTAEGGYDYPAIAGSGDAFDLDTGTVVDWKYVGVTALKKLRSARYAGLPSRDQVSQEYRVQAHLYGLGHAAKGRDVQHVRLVLLARSWKYDDSDEWTEPYDERIARWAIDRYYRVVDQVHELDIANEPEQIVHVKATPSSDACKFCPFMRPGQPSSWDGCAGASLPSLATAWQDAAR